MTATLRPRHFVSDWEYHDTQDDCRGITYHIWTCQHREGFTAYQMTRQPAGGGFTKPTGRACWTGNAAFCRNTGIQTRPADAEIESGEYKGGTTAAK